MKAQNPSFRKTLLAVSVSQSLLFAASSVQAATITVTVVDDVVAVDGNCTLREAVQAANTDTAVDNCASGSGADTIDFDAGLSGSTITLAGSEIEIASELTIDGDVDGDNTADITIDGDNASTIFELTASGSETITIDGLTLQHADGKKTTSWLGGAIMSEYAGSETLSLIVQNSVLTSNTGYAGGAINFKGNLTISNSTISDNQTPGNGGAIYLYDNSSNNSLTISNTTFDNNRSTNYSGGAITAEDTASISISNSTFSNNSAKVFCGALDIRNNLSSVAGTITISNSTFSGNSVTKYSAGAIGIGNNPDNVITITNSTVVNNSASYRSGVDISSPVTIVNSVFAGNSNGDCYASSTATMTNSLVEDGSSSCGTPTLTEDPQLGELQDNGGPTLTHKPLDVSPLIDAGDNSDCGSGLGITTDQRGELRDDGSCDIGAVEVQQASATVVSSSSSGAASPLSLLTLFLLGMFRRLQCNRKNKQ